MTANTSNTSNDEQIRFWNDLAGPRWVAQQRAMDAQLEPLGRAAMDRLDVRPGQRVLDVGCGAGATALELARRVGPAGAVLGVDVSAPMLARAEERAREAGATNARFECVDAQTHALAPPAFDALLSRFGVMFFADPGAAFANLRRALRPGAALAFVCWQALELNPWMTVPFNAARAHLPEQPAMDPTAPGPYAFADPARLRGILEGAGFVDVALDPWATELALAGHGSLDEATDVSLQLGVLGAALRASPERKDAVRVVVREALAPHVRPDGVFLGAAVWLVTARTPR